MRPFFHIFLLLSFPILGIAQETTHAADTSTTQMLEEVRVVARQGIATSRQKEQRASKQQSTDKILSNIPGIQMIRRGNYAWEPTMRSLNAGQINVTLDGMHIFGACTDRMDPVSSYVEPTNLHQINTNYGPGFANYGGGIGGGIDFKLSEAKVQPKTYIKGMMGTGYETNAHAFQTLAIFQHSTPRFAYQVNGIFREAQNYKAAHGNEVPFSQFRKWNLAVSTQYVLAPQHTIQTHFIADEGYNIGYPSLSMDVAYAKAKIASVTHHYHAHDAKIPHIKTKLYYNQIKHAMDDSKRPVDQVAIHMDMPGQSQTAGFYTETAYKTDKHTMQARMSGYVNRLHADMTMYPKDGSPMYMLTIPDAQRIQHALDLSETYVLHKNWLLDANMTWSSSYSSLYTQAGKEQLSGMQAGKLDKQKNLFNIRIGAKWQPNARFNLHAQVGQAVRDASLQEYYATYIFNRLDNYDYVGNTQLKSEKAIQVELGMHYDINWLRIEANVYSYHFDDYIIGHVQPDYQAMTIGASGVKSYNNLAQADIRGAEASIRIKPNKFIELTSSLSYTRGKDVHGHALPLIAPFQSTSSIQTTLWGLMCQGELEYHAAQDHVSTVMYGDRPTPSAAVFNLNLRKSFTLQHKDITCSIRAENLFDNQYYRHLDIMKINRPGRNIVTQLSVAF